MAIYSLQHLSDLEIAKEVALLKQAPVFVSTVIYSLQHLSDLEIAIEVALLKVDSSDVDDLNDEDGSVSDAPETSDDDDNTATPENDEDVLSLISMFASFTLSDEPATAPNLQNETPFCSPPATVEASDTSSRRTKSTVVSTEFAPAISSSLCTTASSSTAIVVYQPAKDYITEVAPVIGNTDNSSGSTPKTQASFPSNLAETEDFVQMSLPELGEPGEKTDIMFRKLISERIETESGEDFIVDYTEEVIAFTLTIMPEDGQLKISNFTRKVLKDMDPCYHDFDIPHDCEGFFPDEEKFEAQSPSANDVPAEVSDDAEPWDDNEPAPVESLDGYQPGDTEYWFDEEYETNEEYNEPAPVESLDGYQPDDTEYWFDEEYNEPAPVESLDGYQPDDTEYWFDEEYETNKEYNEPAPVESLDGYRPEDTEYWVDEVYKTNEDYSEPPVESVEIGYCYDEDHDSSDKENNEPTSVESIDDKKTTGGSRYWYDEDDDDDSVAEEKQQNESTGRSRYWYDDDGDSLVEKCDEPPCAKSENDNQPNLGESRVVLDINGIVIDNTFLSDTFRPNETSVCSGEQGWVIDTSFHSDSFNPIKTFMFLDEHGASTMFDYFWSGNDGENTPGRSNISSSFNFPNYLESETFKSYDGPVFMSSS
eukprot:scaffold7469_cov76-Amphora_coffeaeformis.AAC.1